MGIVICVSTAYAPSLYADFVNWDDDVNIYDNPNLTDPQGIHWNALATGVIAEFGYYIPATNLAWGVLYQLSEDDSNKAFLFHIANLSFHVFNVLLVFGLIWRLLSLHLDKRATLSASNHPTNSSNSALLVVGSSLGTLLFALHPLQVESVAWTSELKGVLSAFFLLCAIHFFIGFSAQRRPIFYGLTTLFYVAALLSKPSAVVFPFLCLVVAVFFLQAPLKRALVDIFLWLLLALPVVVATKLFLPIINPNQISPLWGRLFVASDALSFYLAKFFVPINLGVHYSREPQWLLSHLFYLTWLPFPALIIGLWFCRKLLFNAQAQTKTEVSFYAGSIIFFIVGLLPILGVTINVFQYYSTVADRYAYLPIVGLSIAFASLAVRLNQTRAQVPFNILSVVVIAFLFFQTRQQVKTWGDTKSLWTQALKANPNSWLAHNSMANVLSSEGKDLESIPHYQRAVEIKPDYAQAYNNFGATYGKMGDPAQATAQFKRAVEITPDFYLAHYNLANSLFKQGKMDEAEKHYLVALKAGINLPDVCFQLGLLASRRGDLTNAANFYAQSVDYNPSSVKALFNLGSILLQLDRKDDAQMQWLRALQLDPNLVAAHVNVGVLYYQKGDLPNAKLHLSAAVRLAPDLNEIKALLEKINAQ